MSIDHHNSYSHQRFLRLFEETAFIMHLLYLLPYLFASGEVIANHISARNISASGDTPLAPPKFSMYTVYKR